MQAKRIFLLFIFLWGLLGCSPDNRNNPQSTEITIFAASSLTDAFTELAQTFETQNEGVTVILNFGGSSQLAAQLSEGAPGDLFASANPVQMQRVIEAGRIAAGTEAVFVSNHLTLIVPADNPANLNAWTDLAQPDLQLILAAKGVPVRTYTDELVATLAPDFQAAFYNNLVSEEDNVRQVTAKVALGEADAGIVYTSDVTPDITNQVQQIAIPEAENIVATYPIAPLADAASPELAQRFIDFVLSPDGQAILTQWGFGPPPQTNR